MKIICSKENLSDAINTVQKAISVKTTQPILECIMLSVDESFRMLGTDNDLAIEKKIPAVIFETGSIAVNSKMFGDIIRRLPDDKDISLEVKDNHVLRIECNSTFIEIKGMDSASYPSIPEVESVKSMKIRQGVLRDMIRQTIFAVGMDDYRPILTGSLLECSENCLSIVSIDGMRIALHNWKITDACPDFNVIIPGKSLNEISKILLPTEDEVLIQASENQILFEVDNCKIVSKLLIGEFFNYKNSIPETFNTTVKVSTATLLNSIELASTLSISEKRLHVKFAIAKDKLVVSSKTDIGEIREEIDVDMDGNNIEVGFNPKFFSDALKVIEEEKVVINFSSSVGPCTITPVDSNDFLYLILPLRLKND